MSRWKSPALAHRVAWELSYGPIPEGVRVRQRCGNRLCCNRAHLFLSRNSLDDPETSARAVEAWLALRS
jgi:hypothetical protein